ncbi:MAG TPA: ATP-dependent helicase [Acidimicrobiales bacterium]|nr:ATP-dependent helicase [Acidimicrobiales bacterium]
MPSFDSGLVGLTPAQREAVTADDAVICLLAAAGAGKTRVLTLRVARRVQDGSARADRVLVCTFSRKAAEELRQRLWVLGVGDVRAGTFHRTALQLLRRYHADRGGTAPQVLPDRRALLAQVLATAPGGGGRRLPRVGQVEAEIGWAKARLIGPEEYEEAARGHQRRPAGGAAAMAGLYGRYEEARNRRRAVDLDDLLWRAADVLADDPAYAAAVRWRERHLFVDELQDVNAAQFRLLRLLAGDDPDLFVVGDPNQSVYGWNGADPALLDRVPEVFRRTRLLRLDQNHRCSPQVVAVAAAALGAGGPDAPTSSRADGAVPRVVALDTDVQEAAWVARQAWLAHRPGRRWDQVAVLARTNSQLQLVADALRAERVPFRLAEPAAGPASDLRTRWAADGRPVVQPVDDEEADDEEADDDGERDAVVLTTFHRAKGLQWPAVFVVGLSDGLVPIGSARSAAAREEERRLLYVALTRAEAELACSWARWPDDGAAAAGEAPREPCPWLADVERTCRELEAAEAAVGPEQVAARFAALRARVAGPAGGVGSGGTMSGRP